MKFSVLIVTAFLAVCPLPSMAQEGMKSFVGNLMGRMTLQEKIGQLNLLPGNDITTGTVMDSPLADLAAKGELGAVLNVKGQEKIRDLQRVAVKKSRLGIPLLIGQDVIHGNQTVFPIPFAQACSWDIEAIANAARIAAKEATAQGINWVYSPMVDISLDPRWGRVAEGAGEDPYLGSLIADAVVKAYQGDYGKENVMACVKHFALYGAVEAGRDYNTVDMSRLRMFNQYLPPYKAAADAGAGSFMSSFNLVDGVPATANRWLLTDLLRDKWNYSGFVVTDYGSINEMNIHGVGPVSSCAARAIHAGTDMDMCSLAFSRYIEDGIKNGNVSMEDVDRACRLVLEAKYKLGLFDDPYRFCDRKRLSTDMYTDENRKAARELAAESFVLLKNEGNLLPLKKQGKIALVGPLADDRSNMVGCWSTGDTPELYSTLREAMEKSLEGKAVLSYAQGCNIYADSTRQAAATFGRPIQRVDDGKAMAEALKVAGEADVIVCAMGELAEMSGESSSRADITLPDVQMQLLKALVATGKPVVMLNFSGRPTVMTWESENVDAILNVWYGGSEVADAICDVIFGEKSPCGRLVMTMPRSVGQIPVYYNHLNTGRPVAEGNKVFIKFQSNYIDESNDPLYPFGFGLTYSTFSYSDIRYANGKASVTLANTGKVEATEVVQLYMHANDCPVARPVKELKGFKRVTLRPGESCDVVFDVDRSMLDYLDAEGNKIPHTGSFDVMIGPDSSGKSLRKTCLHMAAQ